MKYFNAAKMLYILTHLRKQRVKAVIYIRTLDILGAEDASCYINVAILFKFASTPYKGVEIIQCRTT